MKRIILLWVVYFSFCTQPVMANNRYSLSGYQHQNKTLTIKNPQQAARLVHGRFGGRVLKVSKQNNRGRPTYQVKLITKEGHIIYVLVDAKSGRIQG